MLMEESNNSGVVEDFPENFMDHLLWEEECREEEEEASSSLSSSLGLIERVTCAMGHLQEVMGGEKELLIQLWVPVKRGNRRVLSTEDQPYSLNPFSQSLALYRDVSARYSFAAEVGSDQLVGLPGRVFLRRMPEWTPDVRFFRSEEYPRIGYARRYQIRASLALPLFQGPTENCVAVMEMVTTHHSLVYASQLHTICHALQAFDLRSSETSIIVPRSLKPHTDEVDSILPGICSSYGLPLAITWCHQDSCLSSLVSACYAADQDSRCFLAACSDHHLLAGQGIAGTAFATKKHCFATDVAILSNWSYPLSHYARMFDLHAALAVPLLTTRGNRAVQFVLEFFFPRDYSRLETHTQRLILDSLASKLSLRFQGSPHLMVDDQLAEHVRDTPTPLTYHSGSSGSAEQLVAEESPCMAPEAKDQKGKQVSVSWEYQREELKLGGGVREPSFSSLSSSSSLENRKRKTKAEKDITLEILRQHFAGSLKDAAKNIGVCPTTLKRICRQHGILRWPSRKIKKVGHSLRKLQVVMDSVEGVQGSLHLASFYSSFPQLQSCSSFPLLNPTQTVHIPPKSPPSSSGSQSSSGSSTCCSSEEQQLGGLHKPALSHPQLLTLSSLQEEQRPVRVTSSLPPLPSATAPRKAKDAMKVKAAFGDSKMRMSLQPHWRLTDLRREIAKRFGMDDLLRNNFSLKYLDDDQEWVLLTCDADLEECIQVYKSSLKETIRILVYHPLSSFL